MKENNQEQYLKSEAPQNKKTRSKWKNFLYVFLVIPWMIVVFVLFGAIAYFAGNYITSSAESIPVDPNPYALRGEETNSRDIAIETFRICLTSSLLIALILVIIGIVRIIVCRRKNQKSKWGKRFIVMGLIHVVSVLLIFMIVNLIFSHGHHHHIIIE
jgi:ABC-type Fe3+ transport system permease subunit